MSDHGNFTLEGHLRNAVDFPSLLVNSLPAIPILPPVIDLGAYNNLMSKPESVIKYIRYLILFVRGGGCDLNDKDKVRR